MESQGEPTREELLLLLSAKDARIKSLTELVEQLAARVAELERQRGKDSSNSSRPSSSDSPFAKSAPKRSSRTRSGRRPGKQDGTPGTTLKQVEDPDEVFRRDPRTCCGCGDSLTGAPIFDERRHQVFDTPPPPPRPMVTEYQVVSRICTGCGTTTVGGIPAWARRRVQLPLRHIHQHDHSTTQPISGHMICRCSTGRQTSSRTFRTSSPKDCKTTGSVLC